MTFPTKLMRLQFGGPSFTTESWSCSLHFTTAVEPPSAESLSDAVEFYMTQTAPLRPSSCKLGFVKFNELDHLTGKYVNPGVTDAKYYPTPDFPGTAANLLPQGATCITLTTALQRGRGHAGRFYLPGYTPPDATGHTNGAVNVQIANDAVVLLNTITTFLPDLTPVVWSRIGDLVQPITGVKVGSIVDTQRRRRSSLAEAYAVNSTAVE